MFDGRVLTLYRFIVDFELQNLGRKSFKRP